jgi:hypothetical protein
MHFGKTDQGRGVLHLRSNILGFESRCFYRELAALLDRCGYLCALILPKGQLALSRTFFKAY